KGGLSSGEGLINEVRDERREWNRKEGREEIVDPGIADKRLMIVEPEFASALAVMERPGNTLSSHIRRAWDGDKLSTITRNSPLCATGAHISIVGHITIDELRARLTRTEAANGFANRFQFPLVRRSKELPFGGSLDHSVTLKFGEQLREKIASAQTIGRVEMTEAAREQWAAVYRNVVLPPRRVQAHDPPGVAVVARIHGSLRTGVGRTAYANRCRARAAGHAARPSRELFRFPDIPNDGPSTQYTYRNVIDRLC